MTGHFEPTTWGAVESGDVVRDKNDRMWIIEHDLRAGRITLRNRREVVDMARPPADKPVDLYRATEAEAVNLAHEVLGGRMLEQIEQTQHTIARALTWRVEPVKRQIVALRDHIDWLHGANVDDVLRRHNGTPTKPSDAKTKRASVEELCNAHDEMHERPDLWPHNWAHYHAPLGG